MLNLHHASIAVAFFACIGCSQPADDSNAVVDDRSSRPTANESLGATNRSVVELTDPAVAKFVAYLEDSPGDHIRLSVKREGPTGFMYDLQLESPPWSDEDFVDQSHGFAIVVSPRDSIYLDGATIDWETRPDGTEGFKFHNPNAIKQ